MFRSRGLRKAIRSCTASRRGPTCRCERYSLTETTRLCRLVQFTRRIQSNAVFSPDGRWVAYASTEESQDDNLRSALPRDGGQVSARRQGIRQPARGGLVTRRKGAVLQSGARPIRGSQRHDQTDALRSAMLCRWRSNSRMSPSSGRRVYDITPKRPVRRAYPGGTSGGRCSPRAADSVRPQLA